jgi:glycosyltransferase involved in cell wall biosynthesis
MHQSAEGEKLRDLIVATDTTMLSKYETRYTISQNVANRLMKHNQLASSALYHPPEDSDKLRCEAYENFIFYPSRIDFMKRQRLLVDAARFLKSDIKIKIAGTGSGEELKYLQEMVKTHQLDHRVELLGHISQEQKIDLLSRCRAVFFGCYDEDYGYVTLESMFSRKPVIVFTDAGGPTEFINDNVNGCIVPVDSKRLATTIDQLSSDQSLAEKMGNKAYESMTEKEVSWENVISRLLAVT